MIFEFFHFRFALSKHKALTDLEHHHKEKKRLKSLVEQLKRDLSQEQTKLHSLMKVNGLIGNKLKAEKEEVQTYTSVQLLIWSEFIE